MRFLTLASITAVAAAFAGGCGQSAFDDASTDDAGCVAQTCEELAANCGKILDRCGNVLECGGCVEGQTCGAAGPNACGVGTCTPKTCAELGLTCGGMSDGCGDVWSCGEQCQGTGGSGNGTGGLGTGGTGGTGSDDGGSTGGNGSGGKAECDYGTTVVASPSQLGTGTQSGGGGYNEKFYKASTQRSGSNYRFISNAWGPNAGTPSGTVNGTAFSVSMTGSRGSQGEPAGFPTVFCGKYSDDQSGSCGLPAAISGLNSVQTGMRWTAGSNSSDYNTSFDIWLGNGSNLQSYLMVWLRFPEGERPAGYLIYDCVTVEGVEGVWDIWAGRVNGLPIVNYVRPKGKDISESEFDVLDFYNDAMTRPEKAGWVKLVGTHINSVAAGFEIWETVSNLQLDDFYVSVN